METPKIIRMLQVSNCDSEAETIVTDLLEACQSIAALADGQGRLNMLEVAGQACAAIDRATK